MGFFSKLLPIIGTVGGNLIAPGIGGAIGGALGSAISGDSAVSNATNAQVGAANQATQLQRDMWNKQLELQAPFREGGLAAQNRLLDYLGLSANTGQAGYGKYARDPTMQDLQMDPGYAFRLDQGIKALDRSAAARGGLLSGAHMKGIQDYGQNMASKEYTNAFNRYTVNRQNQINPLQGFLGQGQSATNMLGQVGQNYANMADQGIMAGGEAQAAGSLGRYNTGVNALQGLTNYFGGGADLNKVFNSLYSGQDTLGEMGGIG